MTRPPVQPLEVIAYAGARGEEEPRSVVLDGCRSDVAEILERWREPRGRGFRVVLTDGRQLVLFCREPDLSWWLGDRPAPDARSPD